MENQDTKVKKFGLKIIISWIVGTVFIVGGAIGILENPPASLFSILTGLIVFPPAVNYIRNQYNFELSTALKVVAVFILGGIAGSLLPDSKTADIPKPQIGTIQQVNSTPTNIPTKTSINNQKPQNTPTPETSSLSYQPIFTFEGSGPKKSEPFTVTGDKFKIKYECSGSLCQAFLQSPKGFTMELIMNSPSPITDESIYYGSGEYYIQSNTMGPFSMTVEDYK